MVKAKNRSFYTILSIVPITIVLATLLVLLSPIDIFYRSFFRFRRIGPIGIFIRSIWMRWVLFSQGISVSISGPGSGLSHRGMVIVSNHQSLLDIPVLFSFLPVQTVFLAKKELFWIPFFGLAAWIAGTQFVDRRRGAHDPSLSKLEILIQSGVSVVIFPEGTRSHEGKLLPFKKGAAVLALKTGTSILPISISGSEACLPKHSLSIYPGAIRVYIGDPIKMDGLTADDRGLVTLQLHNIVSKQLEKLV